MIVLVHNWEGLFRPIAALSRGKRRNVISQRNPLSERDLFRARLRIETELNGCIFPVGHIFANEFAELFASLRKAALHQFSENLIIAGWKLPRIARCDAHEGRVHIRLRKEHACWNTS